MDTSTDEFGIDLANFDIRDYVPEGDGNSLFDDQSQHRADKARQQQQQRSHIQNSSQNLGSGFYGYAQAPDMNTTLGMSNNLPLSSMPNAPLSLEQLNMLLNMGLGQSNMGQDSNQGGGGPAAQADQLKEQLAQQIKLQQLQQLQNHILQQQIQLLTAGTRGISSKDVQQLLTPATTDIRSASQSTQVSPNILAPGMYHAMNLPSPHLHPSNRSHQHAHFNPHSTMSAPASLAFDMSGQGGPRSPASDFLTPLTSPVFPAEAPRRSKRSAEGYEGEYTDGSMDTGPRKRVAHGGPYGSLSINMNMGTVSPALLSSMSRRPSITSLNPGGAMDTPSPIDLTNMGPPARSNSLYLPSHHGHMHSMSMPSEVDLSMPLTIHNSEQQRLPSGPPSSVASNTSTATTNVSPDLMPATPALLMNMSSLSLPSGLVPPNMERRGSLKPTTIAEESEPISSQTQNRRAKASTRSRAMSTSAAIATNGASSSTSKPRRNAAIAASARGASATSRSGGASSSSQGPKVKSTHKDAEQKRRDSLKTSFDELRLLLPAIPLLATSTVGPLAGLGLGGDDSDDPPLPGAMPPRGPPRGEGDGPNKGVSKLVLLRCGNEFIRDLVGRVGRRDDEIERLRGELKRLRNLLGIVGLEDLERDLEKEDEWYREERRRARKKKQEEEDQDEGMADN